MDIELLVVCLLLLMAIIHYSILNHVFFTNNRITIGYYASDLADILLGR